VSELHLIGDEKPQRIDAIIPGFVLAALLAVAAPSLVRIASRHGSG
jgi:hypothetical protein